MRTKLLKILISRKKKGVDIAKSVANMHRMSAKKTSKQIKKIAYLEEKIDNAKYGAQRGREIREKISGKPERGMYDIMAGKKQRKRIGRMKRSSTNLKLANYRTVDRYKRAKDVAKKRFINLEKREHMLANTTRKERVRNSKLRVVK